MKSYSLEIFQTVIGVERRLIIRGPISFDKMIAYKKLEEYTQELCNTGSLYMVFNGRSAVINTTCGPIELAIKEECDKNDRKE